MHTPTSPTFRTAASQPARGLTALRLWAQRLTEVAQSLRPVPRGITYFPLPQTKPLTEKREPQEAMPTNLAQKIHPEVEISLATPLAEAASPTEPEEFAVNVPGPQMPLLGRGGRIILCRLGH